MDNYGVKKKLLELKQVYLDMTKEKRSMGNKSNKEHIESITKILNRIIAYILQTTESSAEKWTERVSKALTSKLVGAGAATSLTGLVAAFGSAGTGTAISSLSGAAAASSTLAWIGGLVGGGMFAGGLITLGLATGSGFLAFKKLSSKPRKYEDLGDLEKTIVDNCSVLISLIKPNNEIRSEYKNEEVELFLKLLEPQVIKPINKYKNEGYPGIDTYHKYIKLPLAIKQLESTIENFKNDEQKISDKEVIVSPSNLLITIVLTGIITGTLNDEINSNPEVLEAIRRSSNKLEDASIDYIRDHLSDMKQSQLDGFANNIKGIYHEILFRNKINSDDEFVASLMGDTNHPGADVVVSSIDKSVIKEFQLKATNNEDYLREHFERYPDKEVLATTEIAKKLNVETTGFSNEEITEVVNEEISSLANSEILQAIQSSAIGGAIIGAIFQTIDLIKGKINFGDAGKKIGESAGITAVVGALSSFLFS